MNYVDDWETPADLQKEIDDMIRARLAADVEAYRHTLQAAYPCASQAPVVEDDAGVRFSLLELD